MTENNPLQLTYFKNLDALRAFAAFAVILPHFSDEWKTEIGKGALFHLFRLGNHGVSLFFVLSGFVITRILLHTAKKENYFKSFYVRRTLRIFPLYYTALLLYYSYHFIDPLTKYFFSSGNWSYFFYLQNFARTFHWSNNGPDHFWSLAVEEHFYFLWPAIIFFTSKKNLNTLIAICVFIIIASLFLRYYFVAQNLEVNVFTFTRLDQLVLGSMIAILETKSLLSKKYQGHYFLLTITGLAGTVFLDASHHGLLKDVFKHSFLGLLFAGIIMICTVQEEHALFKKLLQNKVIQYLGKISYGIYVWHFISIPIVNHFLKPNAACGFLLVCMVTIIVASLSFHFLETPFLKMKAKFQYS